jgi:apolipoprotein D and lipocalin family protein
MMKLLALAGIAALLFGGATGRQMETVASVDLVRYAGTWHEVARIPNWFQRRCAGPSTATYTPDKNGTIRVLNACQDKNGKEIRVKGRARILPDTGNAKLKVSFFPLFEGDYWILGLDQTNYDWAVVGHPSRNYLWFLSREPQVSGPTYRRMLAIAEAAGYDPGRIERVK